MRGWCFVLLFGVMSWFEEMKLKIMVCLLVSCDWFQKFRRAGVSRLFENH